MNPRGNPLMVKGGASLNPSGRPKGSSGVAELIRAKTKDYKFLVDKMMSIAKDDSREGDQIQALKWLADRGLGRVSDESVGDGTKLEMLKAMIQLPNISFHTIKDADVANVQESQGVERVDSKDASTNAPQSTITPKDESKPVP